MAQIKVRNTPSPRLMETIGATNQTTPEAIGELVANSFDARYEDTKLLITVDMRNGAIGVIDNGKGMTEQVLSQAIRIAEDMSQHIKRGKDAKGHFGMGLKTSCASLGWYYEIYTRPAGGSVEYHVAFDLKEFSKRKSDDDAWTVLIDENEPDSNGPLGTAAHGTAVIVSRLKESNPAVSAVLSYLGEAFKGHLKTGDRIIILDSVGSHEAMPSKEKLIPGSKVEIHTCCGPDGAYRITGWVGLDEQTHNNGNYGFNIYRHNQLVEKWDKSWFRAHLMTSRIVGEVNLDFLDATFYKQGLQQSDVWRIVSAHMTEYLKGIVKASNAVSKKHNIQKPAELQRIIGELRKSYDEPQLDYDFKKFGTGFEKGGSKGSKPKLSDAVKNLVQEHSLVLGQGEGKQEISISYFEKTLGNGVKAPFDYIFQEADEEGDPSELQVILYQDHPLWSKGKIDKEVGKIIATSDAIYRVLVEKIGLDSSEALKIRNEWVWGQTAQDGDRVE